jgi:cytoskeleton protein RodZ
MATLGEELKAAREAKGFTLTQIAETTRISHTFLKALEEDDYSVIPGEIFVTGFLRTYAKELGLSEKDMLAKYRELYPKPKEPQTPLPEINQHKPRKPSLIRITRGEKKARKVPLHTILLAGLALGALLTALSLFITKEPQVKTTQPPPAPATAPQTAPPVHAINIFKQATSFRRATTAQAQRREEKGQLVLKLTAKERSWYSYKADNGARKSAVLDRGQTLEITAVDEILLDLGNAGGITAEFNGKPMSPLGGPGVAVKNILFTRDKQGVVLPQKTGQISNVMHGNDPAYLMNR